MRRTLATALAMVLPLLVVPSLAGTSAQAAPAEAGITTREVVFDLVNSSRGGVLCDADERDYRVRGRLIGPTRTVRGDSGSITINVLVHDAGTGAWFWNLRGAARYDYASALARQGRTVLVLDRLGYDASRLADGNDTCLGAQVHMLHQVVQHLYGGKYDPVNGGPDLPHASQVVVHGHGTGATIAQLEAAQFSDTAGLVLLSPATTSPTRLALDALRDQAGVCLSGRTFAPFGATPAAYDRLLFASAPAPVVRAATARRNATPCGDVTSLAGALLNASLTDTTVDVPVLVMRGSRDARATGWGAVRSSETVTRRLVPGAGNALVLEKQAPAVRRAVSRYLDSLNLAP
ncbi:alpha/beta hydrolase [Nocardioides sp.]|uniref:alpha/beta hydrolase n=1 Tax=Nocardioides sp. TaxID=35761 RepID=UPI003519801E